MENLPRLSRAGRMTVERSSFRPIKSESGNWYPKTDLGHAQMAVTISGVFMPASAKLRASAPQLPYIRLNVEPVVPTTMATNGTPIARDIITLLDAGSASSAIDIGIKVKADLKSMGSSSITARRPIESRYYPVAFRISGKMRFTSVAAALPFSSSQYIHRAILGMDFIRIFNLTVDFGEEVVRFDSK